MENKNVMIEEGIYIKSKPTVLDMDKISILQKQLAAEKMGEIVFNLECMRILLSNNTNDQIIDEVLNSDFDNQTMKRISDWFEKLIEVLDGLDNAKKKGPKSSGNTKKASEKTE